MTETVAVSWAAAELGGASLGDARLKRRLVRVAERLGATPGASIPVARPMLQCLIFPRLFVGIEFGGVDWEKSRRIRMRWTRTNWHTACKAVVKQWLCRSGMRWKEKVSPWCSACAHWCWPQIANRNIWRNSTN
jgi:hypothetical protein